MAGTQSQKTEGRLGRLPAALAPRCPGCPGAAAAGLCVSVRGQQGPVRLQRPQARLRGRAVRGAVHRGCAEIGPAEAAARRTAESPALSLLRNVPLALGGKLAS